MNRFSGIALTSLFALILISCQITESPQPTPTAQVSAALPTATAIPVVATAIPSPTPEPTSNPKPTNTPETAVCAIPNPETIPLPKSAHNTIAYISESEDDGEMLTLLATNGRWQSSVSMPGWLFLQSPTPHYLLFPTDPLPFDTAVLQEPFTETCQLPPEEVGFSGDTPNTCYNVKTSPNEMWAAAHTNFNFCGSDLALVDLRGEEPTISKPDFRSLANIGEGEGIHQFRFIGDDKLWFSTSYCEGGSIYLYDLNSGEQVRLGSGGTERWESDGTAVSVNGSYPFRYGNSTWVFDAATSTIILPPTDTVENAYWTPDKTHLLYQTRTDDYHSSVQESVHLSPRQISIVARETGDARLLIDDPAHDYYLCGVERNCGWMGDWIPIRRKPYQPNLDYPTEPFGDLADCAENGRSCTLPLEELALNWQTGELVPWETAILSKTTVLPTPTAIPTTTPPPTGPDMNTDLIFTAEDNRYTLQKGLDQHSLWCVPQTGKPVPWVENGSNFVFVP